MFLNLIDEDMYEGITTYTFEIKGAKDVVGILVLSLGNGRRDAGIVFDRNKISRFTDAYKYLRYLRDKLDNENILIAEITYTYDTALF